MAESLAQYVRNAQPAVDTASVKLYMQLEMHIDTTLLSGNSRCPKYKSYRCCWSVQHLVPADLHPYISAEVQRKCLGQLLHRT